MALPVNGSSVGALSPRASPRPTGGFTSPVTIGVANEGSSFSPARTDDSGVALFSTEARVRSSSTEEPLLINSSVSNNSFISSSKPKGAPDADPEPNSGNGAIGAPTIPMMISTIFQRFLIRMPHTFIAMSGVFVSLSYGFGDENLAISATTFVGVGGTIYCLVRAIFLEVIPEWMLERTDENRKWRHLMNITYTGFITVVFTSAVWKLPDLSAAQGLTFLTVFFGVPYPVLAKFYPDFIDKKPTWIERKHGIKT